MRLCWECRGSVSVRLVSSPSSEALRGGANPTSQLDTRAVAASLATIGQLVHRDEPEASTPLVATLGLAHHELANLARILLEKRMFVGQWLCCMGRGSVHE